MRNIFLYQNSPYIPNIYMHKIIRLFRENHAKPETLMLKMMLEKIIEQKLTILLYIWKNAIF